MALTKPFAENGDKKAIPQTTSDGSVSFDRGFGSFYALPPEEGGLFIDRAQFNQLMYDTTSEILANKQSLSNLSNSTYNKSEVNNLLNAKIDSTKATKILTENLVKTVGGRGADFANLRQALEWASQYSYSGGRFTITLRCNQGMGSPGAYLPIGEALIVIDGQNNTFNCGDSYFFAATMNPNEISGGIFNSNITIKNFTLTYNNTTTNDVYGCAFQLSGINATFDNITININNSSINNNLIVFQHSNCYITNLKINCSGYTNINNVILSFSSTVMCTTPRLNLSNLTGQITALFLFSNSKALTNSTSNIPLPTDKIQAQIAVYDGSTVCCNNEYNNTKLSQAPNTLTQNGIIFKR